MMANVPKFRRTTIWSGEPAERVLLTVGDIDGCGVPEIVTASRRGPNGLYFLKRSAGGRWEKHLMDDGYSTLEAGGVLFDLTGNGRLDFVGGGDSQTKHVSWWECPEDIDAPWRRRLIYELPDTQCHDQFIVDADGDGVPELYFWNQRAKTLFGVKVPEDPRVSPWPGVFPIFNGVHEEDFAFADVDGDGKPELIAGQSWFSIGTDKSYQRHQFATKYVSPRVAAADFTGTGKVEVVLAEGDASYMRKDSQFGRVVRCTPTADPSAPWQEEVLEDELLDPHSVFAADFTGNGYPDLFVAELGDPLGNDKHPPKLILYFNDGKTLTRHVIDEGLGTHEAKPIVLDGKLMIVGKPYRGLRSTKPRTAEIDGVQLWIPE